MQRYDPLNELHTQACYILHLEANGYFHVHGYCAQILMSVCAIRMTVISWRDVRTHRAATSVPVDQDIKGMVECV